MRSSISKIAAVAFGTYATYRLGRLAALAKLGGIPLTLALLLAARAFDSAQKRKGAADVPQASPASAPPAPGQPHVP